MPEGFVEVDGGRLFYEEAGSGQPIVFIHPGYGTGEPGTTSSPRLLSNSGRFATTCEVTANPRSPSESIRMSRIFVRCSNSSGLTVLPSSGARWAAGSRLTSPSSTRN